MKPKPKPVSRAKKLLDIFLSSEAMADVVLLFRGNPELIASKDTILSRIGQRYQSLEKELKMLVKVGVLRAERAGKQTWFGFDAKRDREIQKTIENYLKNYRGSEDTFSVEKEEHK